MDPLHLAHLVLLATWGGVVVAETALELAGDDDATLGHVARVHYRIDLFAELPLLAAVLATGAWLTARVWPPTPLHWAKIGCGLAAVAINLACVVFVVQRRRAVDDPARMRRLHRRIRWAGAGIPFALAAAWLGLAYFRA